MASQATSAIRSLIRNSIAQNPVMIFSKSYCPYCLQVKELFEDNYVPYKALEIDEHDQGTEIQEALKRISKQSTVPNVYIKGNHVGGCDATIAANESGLLKQYLNKDVWTEIPDI
ncbi:thioredoxin reductase [Entomortierella beljakovae]|nr:thioredoxin reductase [Entomortierella beljakovae]